MFRRERGAAAAEFAIVSVVLFLILFGTVEFGIAFNRYQGLHAAAREGARLASLEKTTVDQVVTRVRNSVSIVDGSRIANGCPGTLAMDQGCVAITPSGSSSFQPCNLRSGQSVKVVVRYRTQVQIPLWRAQPLLLTGEGDFTCE